VKESGNTVPVIWHKIKIVLGLALCVVGVTGALVPVIPGVPILLAGVALIRDQPSAAAGLERSTEMLAHAALSLTDVEGKENPWNHN
jgi:uncharacterized protein YqgC (DUF456 family)